MRALTAVAIVPPLLEIVSFAVVERMLMFAARVHARNGPEDGDAARWVDAWLARLPRPWTYSCLRRATVLYYLLRSAGQPVSLCIGVRRDAGGILRAHAWLVRDGAPYLEPARSGERVAEFKEIARFPQTSAPV